MFGTAKGDVTPEIEVDGCVMPCSGVAKCLGFWWRRDLLTTRCVDENIKKAEVGFLQALVCFKVASTHSLRPL